MSTGEAINEQRTDPFACPFLTRDAVDGEGLSWSTAQLQADRDYDSAAFRFVVVIGSRLEPLAACDAIAHALVAMGARLGPTLLGGQHPDADGHLHTALVRYPVVLLSARSARIGKLLDDAAPFVWVTVVDYPEEGHLTTHDEDYRSAIAQKRINEITYRAAALFGPSALLDHLCGHFALYRPTVNHT